MYFPNMNRKQDSTKWSLAQLNHIVCIKMQSHGPQSPQFPIQWIWGSAQKSPFCTSIAVILRPIYTWHTWLAKIFLHTSPQRLFIAFIFTSSKSFQKLTLHCFKNFLLIVTYFNSLYEACVHHADDFLYFSYSLFQTSVLWNKIYNSL